jgi:hypothetical protein
VNLRDELLTIREQHGKLTPQLVLETARLEDHPLHSRFEWADDLAAERWRLEQAHQLIRSVRIVIRKGAPNEDVTVREFHAVRSETTNEYVYETAETIAADPFMSQIVLRDMERRWRQLHERYGHFEEFIRMVAGDIEKAA